MKDFFAEAATIQTDLQELRKQEEWMCTAAVFRKSKRGKGNTFYWLIKNTIVPMNEESIFDELKYKRAFVYYYQKDNRIYIIKFEPIVKTDVYAGLWTSSWTFKQTSPKQ